jgi:molecular chaperone DnaK
MAKGKVIGIDLGTTNSVVAIMEGKEIKVIPNAHGSPLTPSVVGFTDKGERLVGILAKRQAVTNPTNTVYSIKRFMGRRREEVKSEEEMVPYRVVGSPGEPVRVQIREKTFTPQEISAMVLMDLKKTAEDYLGEAVSDAVITCPAYFNDSQRQATKDAGKIAGLNVRRVINEPTSAALAYGLDKKKDQKIAIYDLGGGTYDISVLEVGDNVVEVLSTNGNTHLGGDDFDQRLIHYVADQFLKEQGIDLRKDQMPLQRLKEACERVKCELSSMQETEINLPYIWEGPKHLVVRITRSTLERLIGPLVESTLKPMEQALADAKLNPRDIDEVVLVGGSTRIPLVQKVVREYFGKEPNRSVNPDEVVAVGAAIQGAVLSGEVKDVLLLDVTPLTLGVETLGGVRTPLIARNTTIPTRKSEVFSTASDNQPKVEIHVVQGEREMAADCRTLARFELDGIPPAPRGGPKIEVTFDIDADGILNVKAKDTGTGREQSVKVKASTGLADSDVQRMVTEAEQHRDADQKRRELAETRNRAEQLIYGTEQAVKEHGAKLGDKARQEIEEAKQKLQKVREGDDLDAIKRAMDDLTRASHEVSRILYEQEASKQQPPSAAAESKGAERPPKKAGGGDDIVDADFKVK